MNHEHVLFPVAAVHDRRAVQTGGHGPPLQKDTHRICLFLLAIVFLTFPLVSQAQTNTTSPITNAPADFAPASEPTSIPAPATPQVISPHNLTQAPQQQEDIEDIRPPFFFLRSWLWLWIALGAVGVIALLVLLWNWLKPKKWLSPKSAYELTLEKLEKARALLREEDPMPYAVFVSEIIRTYLGQRFQSPSTRRTTEEFLRQMEDDRTTPLAEHRDLLREFLQSCDMVKFARYQPTLAELEQVQQRALTFVTATKPAPSPGHQNGRLP